MTTSESAAAVDYSTRARFEEVCRQLRESQLHERLSKPIGYWALTGDRRLPYALLDRTVGEILATPFKELARTPAIGKKKLGSLVALLERVLLDDNSVCVPAQAPLPELADPDNALFLDAVSEAHWEMWRGTVKAWNLDQQPLGRFVPTLRNLPTVIWDAPLANYLEVPLSQLRGLKTHGDKRVRNVLEVFFLIHELLKSAVSVRQLTLALRPSFVAPIEEWVIESLQLDELPGLQDIRQSLVLPILNQLESDSDEAVGRLVAGRLGVESPPESVIEQAERLGVTRARVYQLLDHAARIMHTRWPEGRWQLAALRVRLDGSGDQDERKQMLSILQSLLYPERQRSTVTEPQTMVAV